MTAQIKLLDAETITHSRLKGHYYPSTVVMKFLILGALALL